MDCDDLVTARTRDVGVRADPPPAVEEEQGDDAAGEDHHDDDDGQSAHIYGNHMTGDLVCYFDIFHVNAMEY